MSNIPVIAHALAGGAGSVISVAAFYPLLNVSQRLAVDPRTAKPKYTSVRDCVEKIIANEGYTGFFAGLGSAVFGTGISFTGYFYFYELLRQFYSRNEPNKPLNDASYLQVSAGAGVINVLLTNWIWVINARVSTRSGESRSLNTIRLEQR
jgi:adenine nucleotide transporter 17